ncbi:MAG: MFS transporter [Promethearchaeia archaeon]
MRMNKGNVSKFMVIILILMGAFGVMGGGLVAPGLPTIGAAFDAPEELIGMVLSLYTLSAAISLPIIGYLIDSIGRRKVGIACLLIDGGTGLAIMFAPNFFLLLLLRFIQGIGIAGLIPVVMTVFGDLFSGDKRLQLMGYLSGAISVAAVIIPFIGGTLASIDWRFVFAVYGFSIFLAVFLLFNLPETRSKQELIESEFVTPFEYVSSLFVTLKIKKIRNIMIHSFALYFLLYALVTYLPIYLIQTHGFDELFSGLALSGQAVFSALLASRASFIADHLNWRKRAALGFALISASFLMLPYWSKGSYLICFSFIIYGLGMGLVSPTIYNRVTKLAPSELRGAVISVFNTLKYIGMTAAPILIGLSLVFTNLNIVFIAVGVLSALWASITFLSDLR